MATKQETGVGKVTVVNTYTDKSDEIESLEILNNTLMVKFSNDDFFLISRVNWEGLKKLTIKLKWDDKG